MDIAQSKKATGFGTVVAVIGAILISLGVFWIVAQNWHQIPDVLKVIMLVLATAGAFFSGVMLRLKNYSGIGKALIVLGCLLYTATVFLIAQIYNLASGIQGAAWLFLFSWIGVVVFAYIFESSAGLVIGLIEFLQWLPVQFFAFFEGTSIPKPGILAFYFLFAGILLYGLNLIHRKDNDSFSKVYQLGTAIYFLAFTYILSFQALLPMLWAKEANLNGSAIMLLFVLGLAALSVFFIGVIISLGNKSVSQKELIGVAVIIILLSALIGLTALTSGIMGRCGGISYGKLNEQDCKDAPLYNKMQWADGQCIYNSLSVCRDLTDKDSCVNSEFSCSWEDYSGYCGEVGCRRLSGDECRDYGNIRCRLDDRGLCNNYNECSDYQNDHKGCSSQKYCEFRTQPAIMAGNDNIPFMIWAVWIIINLAFIFIILAVMGYGTLTHNKAIINIAIAFFTLDILTRYIGFLMNFWGQLGLALVFITAGIIFVVGGFLIEKWRRRLLKKAEN